MTNMTKRLAALILALVLLLPGLSFAENDTETEEYEDTETASEDGTVTERTVGISTGKGS